MKRNIIIIVVFLIVAFVVAFCFYGKDEVYKEYFTDDLSFESNEALLEKSVSGYDIYFENLTNDIVVLGKKEEKNSLENVNSLKDYSDYVYKQSDSKISEVQKSEEANFYYYTYDYKSGNVFYVRTLFESSSEYWVIDFACQLGEQKNYEKEFLKWASSVKFLTN